MNYAEIKYCDIANGPGVRTSIFVSGCTHHCKNCFNAITWDFNYGEPFTEAIWEQIFEGSASAYVKGITLLGGEPMEPSNQRALLPFVKEFRNRFPDKSVWCFSGYLYEELTGQIDSRCYCEVTDELMSLFDILVDGRFVEELHDITLRFRGSSNQRIIDVQETRRTGEITWWKDDPMYATHKLI